MTGPEADAAARLLERLLVDPVLRRRFRQDPVGASREAGVESLAQEMSHAAGKAMETLDERQSRSSLAGVFMAAALEGVAAYDFMGDAIPHLEEIPESIGQVLSRVDLPAVPGLGVATAEAAPPAHDAGEFPAVLPEGRAAGAAGGSVDPGQFGQEGTGGPAPAEDVALLHNKRVTLDADGIADLKSGKIDPRVASVLTAISRDHEITVSAMMSDHGKNTAGGSVSNHYYGRAVDIATVDGQPVGPGNQAAREVAMSLSRLDPSIRPSEIGSPWALPGSAYFTDGAHQNHLHVAFDDPIASNWAPPENLAAGDAAAGLPGRPLAGFLRRFVAGLRGSDGAGRGRNDVTTGGDDEGGDEPGGLEDPGGDTDAEADAESDGDGGDEDDEDEEDGDDEDEEDGDDENDWADENSPEGNDGSDGDDDDSSDSGSDDSDDSDDGGSAGDLGDSGSPIELGGVAGGYPGDDASQAEIAAWMGSEAQKRGLPPELPVMAGLVESGLRNPSTYGDADSAGFFQMRVSIWNNGEYAGYSGAPRAAAEWFLDHAEAVKQQGAAGQAVATRAVMASGSPTSRTPAPQYRGRYQLRLAEARSLLKEGMEQRGGKAEAQAMTASSSSRSQKAAAAQRARAPSRPSRRRRSTWGPRTNGAGPHRRQASTALASCSGHTPRPASGSRAPPTTRWTPRTAGAWIARTSCLAT